MLSFESNVYALANQFLYAGFQNYLILVVLIIGSRQIIYLIEQMKQTNVEDYFAHKKEDIYESMDVNEPQKELSKDSRKSTKLQKFLSLLDHQIEEEMLNFLNANRKRYEQSRQSQKITLYEDILFIWSFKKDETDFFNKNKKINTDKLLAELQDVTKKKKVTIKERIEKKLCNLTVDELLEYIRNNKDISFDKKHIGSKKIEAGNNPPSINLVNNEENTLSNLLTNEKSTNSKYTKNQKWKPDNSDEQLSHPKVSCLENVIAQHNSDNTQKFHNARPPSSIYKYGTKSISQKIYIFYAKQEQHFVTFKKSTFDSFAAKNQVNQQQINLINPTIINHIQQDEPMMEGSEKKRQQNNDLAHQQQLRQQTGTNSKVIEKCLQVRENESLVEPQRIQYLLNSIQNAKNTAITVLESLRSSQSNDQNLKNIRKAENYINQLENVRNSLMQQFSKTEVLSSDPVQTESNQSQKQQRKNNHITIETGKKTVCSIESPEKELTVKFEEDNLPELKKIFYMMNNNIAYLKIVQEDSSKYSNYIWSNDQDDLLKNFHLNPTAYKEEMRCLLRYKTVNYTLERYQFLQMEVDSKLAIELTDINSNHKESATIKNKQNAMQVE